MEKQRKDKGGALYRAIDLWCHLDIYEGELNVAALTPRAF